MGAGYGQKPLKLGLHGCLSWLVLVGSCLSWSAIGLRNTVGQGLHVPEILSLAFPDSDRVDSGYERALHLFDVGADMAGRPS